jgi:glycosyltransferase involved in cell wall biosynthesis
MTGPLVSLTVTTFNHEKYIGAAVRSALGQTHANVQVVVADDGSTDGTGAEVRAVRDPRLVYLRQENQGPSAAVNAALAACRGRYVAVMSGDDVLHPDRVRLQLEEYARGERRVLFSRVEHIDDDGRPLEGEFYPDHYRAGHTRAELIERLFHRGCVFFGVTAFTEREVFQEAGPYDPLLLQSQDLDMWVRLIKRYPFQVMPEKLYRHRIRNGHGNLSTPTPERVIRYRNEVYLIMKRFFDGLSADLCKAAFRDHLVNPDFAGETEYACEQAYLYLRSPLAPVPLLGVEKLYQLLGESRAAAVLRDRYGLTPLGFAGLLQSANATNEFAGQAACLFVDVGDGWRAEHVLTRAANPDATSFEHTFDLTRFPAVKEIAWSPLEGSVCRVRIDELCLHEPGGAVRAVDHRGLRTTGVLSPDGTFVFETAEPRVFVPVGGPVAGVTIRGRQEVEPQRVSIGRLATSVAELRASVGELRATLDRMRASRSWRLTAPLRGLGRLARRSA